MRLSRRQWVLLGVALLLLAAVKLALLGWYWQREQASVDRVTDVACADLSACRLPSGATVAFVPYAVEGKPFTIDVLSSAPSAPVAEFTMQSMDMGFNRYTFVRAGANWRAQVQLPVCVSQSRDWLMTLTLEGRRYRIPFSTRVDR